MKMVAPTRHPARNLPDMIVLEGQSALSPFRRDRLEQSLRKLHQGIRIAGASWLYFIDAEMGATPDRAALGRIQRLRCLRRWSISASTVMPSATRLSWRERLPKSALTATAISSTRRWNATRRRSRSARRCAYVGVAAA